MRIISKGMNVFLQGNPWDLGADGYGSTIILNDSTITTAHIGKAGLFNLWL